MAKSRDCLTLSAYITANVVRRSLSNKRSIKAAIRRLRLIGITKAYVEVYRSGIVVDEKRLVDVRDNLRDAGLGVSGGIATTHGCDFTDRSTGGPYWVCYSSLKSIENLEKVARTSARVFDEVIIDDFLCTSCRCWRCREEKGDRDWATLYRDLLVDFTTSHLIAPAREENPKVRLIIKFPQWYDRFHVFGYDVVRQSQAFDAVWVGTEIRDPRVGYVHQYEPFANYTYLRSVAKDKVAGAWFDFLWCYPEVYLEQAYQSLLAGARELILFSYGPEKYDRANPNARALIKRTPMLEKICSMLRGKVHLGIEAYKPPGSDPGLESFIFDYMGVLGFPLIVTASRPQTRSVFLPMHSLNDSGIEEYIAGMDPDRVVLATSGLVEGLEKNPEILNLFGLSEKPVARRKIFTYRFRVHGNNQFAEERVLLRSYLRPKGAHILAEAVGGKNYPILTINRINGSSYLVACLDTFRYMPHHGAAVTPAEPVSLVYLPQGYLDPFRNLLLSSFGFTLKGPPKIGVYLYSSNKWHQRPTMICLENFSDQLSSVEISGGHVQGGEIGNAAIEEKENGFLIRLPRRELEILQFTE